MLQKKFQFISILDFRTTPRGLSSYNQLRAILQDNEVLIK